MWHEITVGVYMADRTQVPLKNSVKLPLPQTYTFFKK